MNIWTNCRRASVRFLNLLLHARSIFVLNSKRTPKPRPAQDRRIEEVVAPKGLKRVGGKIKADVKKGFTLMVACNLETRLMEPPFFGV